MQNPILQKLISIGFREYEVKAFMVLMKGVPMSASEIAKEAKVLRTNIYDILKSFTEKGYCNEIETNTILKYQIIEPRIIADKIEREYNKHNKDRISTLKEAFSELEKDYYDNLGSNKGKIDNVELIRGFNKHRLQKYLEFIRSAKNEILAMNRLKGLISDDVDDFTRKFTRKGGIVRSIFRVSLDLKIMKENKQVPVSASEFIKVCNKFESYGEKIKLTQIDIPNLVIVDGEKIFLNITGEHAVAKDKQTDLVINDRLFARNMKDLFETYWNSAVTPKEYSKQKTK